MPPRRRLQRPSTNNDKIKKRKVTASSSMATSQDNAQPQVEPAIPPLRQHTASYHRALLLSNPPVVNNLLQWYEQNSLSRSMPWRKAWVDPAEHDGSEQQLAKDLNIRAYEVWVSEVMLQQTRISTVIPYFNSWIAKWPTIEALAAAKEDEVLGAWKGLGYYSRATRIHKGAQQLAQSKHGPLPIPSDIEGLEKLPGIGRYTAGAISSIVFGHAVPLLDGNVSRVLSRQLGVYCEPKPAMTELFWKAAEDLVQNAAGHGREARSKTPGMWNQALMDLGSTICTPIPKCGECPIKATCRAYAEGEALVDKKRSVEVKSSPSTDIEDACVYCQPFDEEVLEPPLDEPQPDPDMVDATAHKAKRRRTDTGNQKISAFFASKSSKESLVQIRADPPSQRLKEITSYCSRFPKKSLKKKVAEEECVVCIVATNNTDAKGSRLLLEQRPNKAKARKKAASEFVRSISGCADSKHEGEIGDLLHVFTHLKLKMYIHYVTVDHAAAAGKPTQGETNRKWVGFDEVEQETLWTGMVRSWEKWKSRS